MKIVLNCENCGHGAEYFVEAKKIVIGDNKQIDQNLRQRSNVYAEILKLAEEAGEAGVTVAGVATALRGGKSRADKVWARRWLRKMAADPVAEAFVSFNRHKGREELWGIAGLDGGCL